MSLGIQIEVSPGNALSTTASVETALGKVEAAGPRVGAAISKGMQQGSAAAERAKASAAGLSQQMQAMTNVAPAFKAIADAMQREKDMLDAIRGPMRQYQQDLQVLNALYDKGSISASEYMNQRDRMRHTAGIQGSGGAAEGKEGGLIEGSFAQAIGGQFGEAGGLIGGLLSNGTLEAGAIVGLGAELIHLGDEYTEIRNKALEFGGSLGTVDEAIQSQLDLAGQLHGSLDETMELSIAVKERADDLGLSLKEQGQFARSFGEDIRLSGGSLTAASQALQQFILALESGQGAGRYMKTLMAEYPELAETLEDKLGVTSKQLIDLGNRGMLTPKMVAQAMIAAGDEIDAKFGQVGETTSQAMGHALDEMKMKAGSSGFVGALHDEMIQLLDPAAYQQMEFAAADAERAMVAKGKPVVEQIEAMHGSIIDLDDVRAAIQQVSDAAEKAKIIPPDYDTGASKILDDYILKYKQLNDELEQLSRVDVSKLTPRQEHDLDLRKNADASDIASQSVYYGGEWLAIRQEEEKRQQGRQDLLEGLRRYQSGDHAMGISPDEYSQAIKKYQEPLSEYAQWLKGVLAPQETYTKDVRFLEAAHRSGAIGAGLYVSKLREAQTAYETWLEKTGQKMPNANGAGIGIAGPSANDLAVGAIQIGDPSAAAGQALVEKYSGISSAIEQYRKAQIELTDAVNGREISESRAAQLLGQVKAQILGASDATDKFNAELTKDKALLDAGLMLSDAYAMAVKKISTEQRDARLAAGQGSIGDAFSSQFEKMAKDGGNAGQVMASTFGSAVGEMNTALEGLATGANVTWRSIGTSFEKMLVEMGLKLVESEVFKLLGGAIAGSAVSAGGFSGGGDVTVPHAAFGYSGYVGGTGGTDSKLFAAMVTPGEHVSIRTPEQVAAAGRASSAAPQVHVIVPDNKRALLKTAASADGQRQVINTLQRNKGALRGLVK